MIVRRPIFFLLLSCLVIIPPVAVKLAWILKSTQTTGVMSFEGMGQALDKLRSTYSVFYFEHDNDTTWFNSSANYRFKAGDVVPVRYIISEPADARLDTFTGIWLGTLLGAGIPLLIIIVIFLNPHIVPFRKDIRISRDSPFLYLHDRN